MKRGLVAILVVLLGATPLQAAGRARLVSFGPSGGRGVSASAFAYDPPKQTSGIAASSGPSETVGDPTLNVHLSFQPTNRCTATNVGGKFTYTFANGVECASFAAPSPDEPVRRDGRRPRPPSAEQIAAALFDRAVSLAPRPQLEVAPSRIGLAGLRTYFWLAVPPRQIVATASAGPTTVTAVATPAQFVWDFGDGHDRATETPGLSWTPRRRGSIGHLYQAAGRYSLGVEVLWEARWRAGGSGPWRPLGFFSTSDSRRYAVREILAWLARQR